MQKWLAGLLATLSFSALAWEPERAIEFMVPNGIGGGSDVMARKIKAIAEKHKLAPKGILVSNRTLGAGGESFLEMKNTWNDGHRILVSSTCLFTVPIERNLPVSWAELTPAAMPAQDLFVLWVPADSPVTNAKEFSEQLRNGGGRIRLGGTNIYQEDNLLGALIEKATGGKFSYVPYPGGGAVANALARNEISASVNNPIEAVNQWQKDKKVKPICVLDTQRMANAPWKDIPTCKEQGLDVSYRMMRGMFLPPKVSSGMVDWWRDFFAKVAATDDWKSFLTEGALVQASMSPSELKTWLEGQSVQHEELMKSAFGMSRRTKKGS